jgi:hypothetical protein
VKLRGAFVLAAALAASLCASAGGAAPLALKSTRGPLFPGQADRSRAGRLIFRGGLVLSSPDKAFGGWSDLAVSADGRTILAISDEAHWLKAQLTYDADGELAGAGEAEIAPMLDEAGKPMRGKAGDAEGLALAAPNDIDGTALVSFEENVRVWRYELSKGFSARPANVPIGDWVKRLHNNRQIEAITLLKPDTLLAFAETKISEGDDILGAFEAYPGASGRTQTRMVSVIPHDPFAITSVAPDGDGGIFLLERRFSFFGGLGAEVRHVNASELHPGARIQGTVIAALSAQDASIDNMEGLAMRKGPAGETLLYMISDDNYSPFERTLLLMFEVAR